MERLRGPRRQLPPVPRAYPDKLLFYYEYCGRTESIPDANRRLAPIGVNINSMTLSSSHSESSVKAQIRVTASFASRAQTTHLPTV